MNFRYAMNTGEGPGPGFDEDPISFGEAFGINPDGSPYEAETEPEPEPDPTPDPTPEPEPEPVGAEPTPSGEDGAGATTPEPPQPEWMQRWKTPEDIVKSHRELEQELSRRAEAAKANEAPPPPPPSPILKGEVGEIKTEADLYNWAAADPESAAMFAMENHERLNPEQMTNVMDNWLAREPWKAISTISAWNLQMAREEMSERQAVQDAHYMDTMRDEAIAKAVEEMPAMGPYKQQLGEYIEQHPKLQDLVEGAKTATELKSVLQGAFYMFAGPQLASQALEAQVTNQIAARAKAEADAAATAEAEQAAARATTFGRNTAAPPSGDNEQDEAIRQKILNSKR